MSKLSFGSITIIVNGYTTNNGLPYFQKAVPAALRARLGKATIKIRLHERNGHFAVQCHRLEERYSALFRAMRDDESITLSEAKLAALSLLEQVGLKEGDGSHEVRIPLADGRVEVMNPAIDILQDYLGDNEINPSLATSTAFKALNNQLPVLLSEAFSIYLDNHQKGKDKKFIDSQRQHWDKLVNFLGDKAITAVTRKDAKAYRDNRLASGVAPTTVTREINVIRAVFTKAIRELSLGIPNEFAGIEIPNGNKSEKERIPFTKEEVKLLVKEALKLDDEKRRLVLVLAFTGARLGEIVGLRKVDFDSKKGFIHIREHDSRSIKNQATNRIVPLLPHALEALTKQARVVKGDYLFPIYSNKNQTKADSASATLNKWAQNYVVGKTMHCFRHSLRDFLRAVMCPESVAKEIGGWSTSHDVSIQYGQGYPQALKLEWLKKAYTHCY
jgi:integrase